MIRWFSLRTTGWTHYGFQQLKTPNKTREQFASFKDTHVPPFKAISAYPTLSDTAHFKFKKHCLPFEEFKEIFMKDILYQNGTWDIKNEICSNYDPHIARESREIGGTCAWTLLQYEDSILPDSVMAFSQVLQKKKKNVENESSMMCFW